MKLALVCDSMSAYGGAERVIEQILKLYPSADLFALLDLVPKPDRAFLADRQIRTSFLQRLPQASAYYRKLLHLWNFAIEQFDVSDYDVVISSHHSVAQGVITRPFQLHISYVHSPMRYAWDLQHEYLARANLDHGALSWWARRVLHRARLWDYAAGQRPDVLMASSHFVQKRIQKYYRRPSTVVYPPVAVNRFASLTNAEAGYYLSVCRLVPYKGVDIIAEAFSRMPTRQLKIVGTGPELGKLKRLAAPNIEILGWRAEHEVEALMAGAKALLFAGIEDFGITLVEAQAAGIPVVAYELGGAAETVRDISGRDPTGVLVREQTPEAFAAAVDRLESARGEISTASCRRNALRFSEERFRAEFRDVVEQAMSKERADERATGSRSASLQLETASLD